MSDLNDLNKCVCSGDACPNCVEEIWQDALREVRDAIYQMPTQEIHRVGEAYLERDVEKLFREGGRFEVKEPPEGGKDD